MKEKPNMTNTKFAIVALQQNFLFAKMYHRIFIMYQIF